MTARPIQVRVREGWVLVGYICEPYSKIWVDDGDLRIKDKYGIATFPAGSWRYLPLTDDTTQGME